MKKTRLVQLSVILYCLFAHANFLSWNLISNNETKYTSPFGFNFYDNSFWYVESCYPGMNPDQDITYIRVV
jgi:hypothetical protein